MTRFPGPGFALPSPPFHVPRTVVYKKYKSKNLLVGSGWAEKELE